MKGFLFTMILNYVCKGSEKPNEFSIFARIIKQNNNSVVIDRYQRFGKFPVGKNTLSIEDFQNYYEKLKEGECIVL